MDDPLFRGKGSDAYPEFSCEILTASSPPLNHLIHHESVLPQHHQHPRIGTIHAADHGDGSL